MWGRWARRIAILVVVLALAWPVIGGFVLWRVASGILTVGPLAEVLGELPVPAGPLELGYRGDPGEAFGLPFETVEVETPLGPAPAWYVPGEQATGAIYVHGIAGAREDGYRALSILSEAGYPVLLITYRNDPDAPADPGGAYAFGLTEWRDLEAAVAWMAEQGHDDIVLVAESMGGGIAGQFLSRSPEADRVVGLALDAPALDFRAVLAHIAERIGMPWPSLVARSSELWLAVLGPVDLREAQVVDVVAGFDGPLFLAHGTADTIVPVSISDEVEAQRQGETFGFRTGGDHLKSFAEDEAGYRETFDLFLAALR
jgi:pimeloyl-ACP methyl ester carboxylesterase